MRKFKIAVAISVVAFFGDPSAIAAQGLEMLPASKEPPPEVAQMEQMAKQKVPPPRKEKLSKKQLEEILMANPQERGKLQAIKSGKKLPMLPASKSPPPEVAEMEKRAKQPGPPLQAKRLSKQELERILMSNPAERQKLEQIKKQGKPGAALDDKKGFSLNWLNPFHVSEAHAGPQLLPASGYPLTLEHQNNWGFSQYYPWAVAFFRHIPYFPDYSLDTVEIEGDGYAGLSFSPAVSGAYILNFYTWAGSNTSLALKIYNSRYGRYDVLKTWENPTTGWKNYSTILNLESGWHSIHFESSNGNFIRVGSITIDQYSWRSPVIK